MERMSAVVSLDESERGNTVTKNGAGAGSDLTPAGQQLDGQPTVVEEREQVVLIPATQANGVLASEEETFHTPLSEGFAEQQGSSAAGGVVGLAPPLPVDGSIPVHVAQAQTEVVPVQTQVPVESAAPPTIGGQDYAGENAGQREELGRSGVAQRDSRRRDRHPDELASVTSEDSSSSDDGMDDSMDYDTEYDQEHEGGVVTEEFIRWIEHLPKETLVHITGILQKPNNSTGEIKEASPHLKGMELKVKKCFVVGRVFEHAPFQFNEIEGHHVANEEERKTGAHLQKEAEESGPGKISVRQEMANRTYDLRVSGGSLSAMYVYDHG